MIGVSYKGHKKQINSEVGPAPSSLAAFEKQFGLGIGSVRKPVTNSIPEALLKEVSPFAGASSSPPMPDFQDDFTTDNGDSSVTKDAFGKAMLKGDDAKPVDEKTRFYMDRFGQRGWLLFDEIDPPGIGATVGDDDERSIDGSGPWSVEFSTPPKTEDVYLKGELVARILYSYSRTLHFSAMGRALGCTTRRRNNLGMFLVGKGGGGLYEVRPRWNYDDPDYPVLAFLDFGSAEALATWSDEKQDYLANYDDDGQLLEVPAVSVVPVDVACGVLTFIGDNASAGDVDV